LSAKIKKKKMEIVIGIFLGLLGWLAYMVGPQLLDVWWSERKEKEKKKWKEDAEFWSERRRLREAVMREEIEEEMKNKYKKKYSKNKRKKRK
jgi:hypothetical protein